MTPQKQLIEHDPENDKWGDCQRTCVAVILDMHASDVPHFCDMSPNRGDKRPWTQQQDEFLASLGYAATTFAYHSSLSFDEVMELTSRQNAKTPMILLGKSNLGCNHVVVVLDGEIACDPSGNGIVGPCIEGTWELTVLAVRS
ncbi:MAG: hypothetical protein E6R03_15710 [Hyphomicrobiaceae bacterium]|nr:MAG: hypothetical protein E6R03_15710 [Hyphomicrobiaceae bacterium]